MRDVDNRSEILSREELEALLSSLAEASDAEERALTRRGPYHAGPSRKLAPFQRIAEEYAEEHGRALSTHYQIPLEFSVIACDLHSLRDFGASLLDIDLVAVARISPGGHWLYLSIGRTLFFAWLTLAYGARKGIPLCPIPDRPYTRIEESFYRRIAAEVLQLLGGVWRNRRPVEIELLDLVHPDMLPGEATEKHLTASFDITGLGDLSRLRIAVPANAVQRAESGEAHPLVSTATLKGPVLDTTVRVRVEAGVVEVPLQEVANLRVGDVLPIARTDGGELIVRVENEAKFRAIRGSLGERLAVQLTERL